MANMTRKRNWLKNEEHIYMELVKRNRYSDYLDFENFDGNDAAILQSLVLADIADTVIGVTDMSQEEVVEMFECFFECKFRKIDPRPPRKRVKIKWSYRGLEASKIQDTLVDHGIVKAVDKLTSHELGKILSYFSRKNKLIDRRMRQNRYLYICNGYKTVILD